MQPGGGARRLEAPACPAPAGPRQIPASTSPEPAVASQGGAFSVIEARPSGRGHHRVGALQQHDRAGSRRRGSGAIAFRRISVACEACSEQSRELALVRGQHRRRRNARPDRGEQRFGRRRQSSSARRRRAPPPARRRAPRAPCSRIAAPTPPPGPSTTALSRRIGEQRRKLLRAIDRRAPSRRGSPAALIGERVARAGDA